MELQPGPAQAGPDEGGQPAVQDGPAAVARVRVPETGEPRVDAALQLLDQLPDLPVSGHAAVFEQVHAQLAGALGELEPLTAEDAGGARRAAR